MEPKGPVSCELWRGPEKQETTASGTGQGVSQEKLPAGVTAPGGPLGHGGDISLHHWASIIFLCFKFLFYLIKTHFIFHTE